MDEKIGKILRIAKNKMHDETRKYQQQQRQKQQQQHQPLTRDEIERDSKMQ